MKTVFIISSLSCGGAERVLALMANYWSSKGEEIYVLTLSSDLPFYDLDPSIRLVKMGLLKDSKGGYDALMSNLRRLFVIMREIRKIGPDLVISFMTRTNILASIGSKLLRIPVIVSDHADPYEANKGGSCRLLQKISYNMAAALVVLTEHAAGYYHNFKVKKHTIGNPLKKMTFDGGQNKEKIVIGIGRLSREKGFDLLIRAFAAAELDEWSLMILGDGKEREYLEDLSEELGLKGRVFLPGLVKGIDRYLARAAIFVLSSRSEGFGNVLCEAMATGLPCVSFRCSGPSSIISHGINGLLVEKEDVAALARTISDLASTPSLRSRLGKEAEKIKDKLSIETIMTRWEEVRGQVRGNKCN